jgi:hypothetical protein
MKLSVSVDMEVKDGRSYLSINFPKQQQITVQETSHILAGAISLLIKSSSRGDKIKDYELIKEVIDHLNSEFVNIDSYTDAYVSKNMV